MIGMPSAYALECALESVGGTAVISQRDGKATVIDRAMPKDCLGIKVIQGKVRLWYGDVEGAPKSKVMSEGDEVTRSTVNAAPDNTTSWSSISSSLRMLLAADQQVKGGFKRALPDGVVLLPSGKILPPMHAAGLEFDFPDAGYRPVSNFYLANESGKVLYRASHSTGVISIPAKLLVPGGRYKWGCYAYEKANQPGKGKELSAEFEVASLEEARNVAKELDSALRSAAVESPASQFGAALLKVDVLMRFDLDFEVNRILSSVRINSGEL